MTLSMHMSQHFGLENSVQVELTSTLMAQRPIARTDFLTKSTSTSVAYLAFKNFWIVIKGIIVYYPTTFSYLGCHWWREGKKPWLYTALIKVALFLTAKGNNYAQAQFFACIGGPDKVYAQSGMLNKCTRLFPLNLIHFHSDHLRELPILSSILLC